MLFIYLYHGNLWNDPPNASTCFAINFIWRWNDEGDDDNVSGFL